MMFVFFIRAVQVPALKYKKSKVNHVFNKAKFNLVTFFVFKPDLLGLVA